VSVVSRGLSSRAHITPYSLCPSVKMASCTSFFRTIRLNIVSILLFFHNPRAC